MTRAAPYGSAAWRAWKHDHHWAGSGTQLDPLGAGNTALIAALGVTPLAFYDVRKNLTLSGSNVTSLKDVKGDGTYGSALLPPLSTNQPTWDGTVVQFSGAASPNNQYVVSASTIAGLDLSTALTVALIADGQTAGSAAVPLQIGAAANGSPWWRLNYANANGVFTTNTVTHGAPVSSTVASGSGNIRPILITVNVAGTDAETIEIPNTAKVTGTTAAALASGNQFISVGGSTSGTGPTPMRFRALLAWAGGYTAGQKSTLLTYAQTYHSAVAA